MRFNVLLGALALLTQIPAFAQGTGTCGVFNGVYFQLSRVISAPTASPWRERGLPRLPTPGGALALFEVGTFPADGSYSGANVNPSHTDHKGVWLRIGDRKFVFTFMFFTHDDKGVFNGIVKARTVLTLAEDRKSYDSVVERVVMDTSGKELSVTPGIRGTQCPDGGGVPKEPASAVGGANVNAEAEPLGTASLRAFFAAQRRAGAALSHHTYLGLSSSQSSRLLTGW